MGITGLSLYKNTLIISKAVHYVGVNCISVDMTLLFCQDEEEVRYLLFLKVDTKRHIVGRGEVEGEKEEK